MAGPAPGVQRLDLRLPTCHSRSSIIPPGGVHLLHGEIGEILLAQDLSGAVRAGHVDVLAAAVPVFRVVRPSCTCRRRRNLGLPELALLADGAQVQRREPVLRRPPEGVERLLEQLHVPPAMHQDGPQGAAEIALPAYAHELQGGHRVQHPPRVHVKPKLLQYPAEQEQVMEEVAARVHGLQLVMYLICGTIVPGGVRWPRPR